MSEDTKAYKNGNGKWQLAFWIMTVFLVMGGMVLGKAVFANDRLRATEDIRIVHTLEAKIEYKFDKLSDFYKDIDARLARIEGSLGIKVLR